MQANRSTGHAGKMPVYLHAGHDISIKTGLEFPVNRDILSVRDDKAINLTINQSLLSCSYSDQRQSNLAKSIKP